MKESLLLGLMLTMIACSDHNRATTLVNSKITQVDEKLKKIADVPSGPNSYSLECVDRSVCWVGDFTKQWKTENAGKNWTLIYSSKQKGDEVDIIKYVDKKTGWLLTQTKFYKTEDGGQNWLEQRAPWSPGELRSLFFISEGSTGWVGGGTYKPATKKQLDQGLPNNAYDPQTKMVLEQSLAMTKDSGKTWNPQTFRDRIGRIYGLSFLNDRQGIALTSSGPLFTLDGGDHWGNAVFRKECTNQRYQEGYDMRPLQAFFLDSKNVWLTWEDSRMTKSIDGGQTWCDQLLAGAVKFDYYDQFFKKIHFIDEIHGFALGANRLFYARRDGGKSWTKLLNDAFDDIYFHDKQTAWLVSKAGIFELDTRN
jgi:photosystem II stability/assembly factor-like uncharacterized protein